MYWKKQKIDCLKKPSILLKISFAGQNSKRPSISACFADKQSFAAKLLKSFSTIPRFFLEALIAFEVLSFESDTSTR